jgi:hypothetical protein
VAATHYSKPAFTAHLAHPHEAAEIDRLIAHGLPAAQRANTPQFAWPASCGGFRRGWGGWGWGLPLAGVGLGLGYYVLVLLGPLRRMGRLHLGQHLLLSGLAIRTALKVLHGRCPWCRPFLILEPGTRLEARYPGCAIATRNAV